jgi:16S rRNA (guanine(966)-N(2))-methyltransferase RsmD
LRIIGGTHKGKQLLAPKNLPVRPTTDFAKEGLFNVLNNKIDFEETTVLDLFCGTGNISLEFASRGVKKTIAIDMHSPCLNFIRDTTKALNLQSIYTERADVFKYLDKCHATFDLIFADPPYELANIGAIYDLVFKNTLLNPEGLLIIEHGPRTTLSEKEFYVETRKYGNVNFSFFKKQ